MLKVVMLSTGEEVLHGDIVDTNAAWLSRLFFEEGYELTKRSTVGDNPARLKEELMMLSLNSDVVIVNGGLGPTTDDLTTEVVADLAEKNLVLSDYWVQQMTEFFAKRGKKLSDVNLKQARLPEGAELLDNPIGTACGFKLKINDCDFYFTPGVPSEFKMMVKQQILPDLRKCFPEHTGLDCHKIYTLGSSESELAELLDPVPLPDDYTIGYRSYIPFIEIKLFGPRGDDEIAFKVIEAIYKRVSKWTVSIDKTMLSQLSEGLNEKKQTYALAEEGTSGWLANHFSNDDVVLSYMGSSWVLGPNVSQNIANEDPLAATLALAGATKAKSQTNLALVTGRIDHNQFCMALSTPEGEWGQILECRRNMTREDLKTVIGTIAMDMFLRYLSGKPVFGQYSIASEVKKLHLPGNVLS
ncbi:CinA family nicotinamide mononucleotide deamidase-related protein [Vibrio salinus]|uniref:CinA family nicotinamide mononucleotide deamidase-related protein n=1 Tax=Vibrio salinus TaxID=2899784 RepID=UPI001E5B4D27|nr:CinA family nicotinamide mononucleotide deamidase-related protein [Vibrio salinus]MCE0492611.1 CinA family nicotinamide mononucleotide deamidase-related protein [Vibrio salinus]